MRGGRRLQLNAFAYQAFGLDGLQYLRQGFKKIAGAFYGIVENYDCSRFKVWYNIAGTGFTAERLIVVTADDIPHNDFVALS